MSDLNPIGMIRLTHLLANRRHLHDGAIDVYGDPTDEDRAAAESMIAGAAVDIETLCHEVLMSNEDRRAALYQVQKHGRLLSHVELVSARIKIAHRSGIARHNDACF